MALGTNDPKEKEEQDGAAVTVSVPGAPVPAVSVTFVAVWLPVLVHAEQSDAAFTCSE